MSNDACRRGAAFYLIISILTLVTCFLTFLCGRHLYNQWKENDGKIPEIRYYRMRILCAISFPFLPISIILLHWVQTYNNRALFMTMLVFELTITVILTAVDKSAEFYKLHDTFKGTVYALPDRTEKIFICNLTSILALGIPWWFRYQIFGSIASELAIDLGGLAVTMMMCTLSLGLITWLFLQFEKRLTDLISKSDGALTASRTAQMELASMPGSEKNHTDPSAVHPEFVSNLTVSSSADSSVPKDDFHCRSESVTQHFKLVSQQTMKDIRSTEQDFVRVVAKESSLAFLMFPALIFFGMGIGSQKIQRCPTVVDSLVMAICLAIGLTIKGLVRFHFREPLHSDDYYRYLGWMDRWLVKLVILHAKIKAGVSLKPVPSKETTKSKHTS